MYIIKDSFGNVLFETDNAEQYVRMFTYFGVQGFEPKGVTPDA